MQKSYRKLIILLAACLILCSCGISPGPESSSGQQSQGEKEPQRSVETHYEIPDFKDVTFDDAKAEGNDDVRIDLTHVSEGYVAVRATAEQRLKFRVKYEEEDPYTYDLKNDGTVCYYPLQSGNGNYLFQVWENISDKKYFEKFRTEAAVTLLDEFQPFLHANCLIDYRADNQCVIFARKLAESSADSIDFIGKIYQYVVKNITYDYKRAETVTGDYVPDLDDVLAKKEGICFDYAALAAAMLRSQGIPTKMIFGYVAPGDIYHAWNMVYTKEHGWITVKFSVDEKTWNRVDLTFSASGTSSKYIGDGTNYADIFQY